VSDSNVIPFHNGGTIDDPPSTEVRDGPAEVLPLRAAGDRRGKYKELRAFIDAAGDIEVCFETREHIVEKPARRYEPQQRVEFRVDSDRGPGRSTNLRDLVDSRVSSCTTSFASAPRS